MPVESMPLEPDPDNPFGLVGGSITGSIQPEDLDEALNQEILDHLAELALGSLKHDRCAEFQKGIKAVVRRWLVEEAAGPSVRDVACELRRLQQKIEACLPEPAASDFAAVADLRSRLSASAVDAITHGALGPPTDEDLRRGDHNARFALFLLYGLIPGSFQRRSGRRTFIYRGPGCDELSAKHRPRDSRLEKLIFMLAHIYRYATGRGPGRGERAPFQKLVTVLLQQLHPGETRDRGDKAIRRVIARFKTYEPE